MSGISPACHDLDLFFDGELAEPAAAAYRAHLADCTRCSEMLRGRVLEAVAVSKAAAAPAIPLRKPAKKPRWVWAGAGVAALVAACVALWLHKTPQHGAMAPGAVASGAVAIKLKDERGVDVRFSATVLDRHRPVKSVMRSGSARTNLMRSHESFDLVSLAEFEKRDANALVGALALEGNLEKAEERAKNLPDTAGSFADRAALALLETGDPQKAQVNAERALSLARQALRLEPKHPQAMWNEAVALERLQLVRAAADMFDAIAKRGEPGWSAEAKDRAEQHRAAYRTDIEQRQQLYNAALAMIRGGAPMVKTLVDRDKSLARLAFHLAVASTADRARLAALAPLAQQLDLGKELAQIRASHLAGRAPLARQIANVTSQLASLLPPRALAGTNALEPSVLTTLRALRGHAKNAAHADISRAITLLIEESRLDAADIVELSALSSHDPWWRLVAVQRHLHYLVYLALRPLEAEPLARNVISNCNDSLWCSPIIRTLAHSHAEVGHVDSAYRLAAEALRMARAAADRKEEGRVFYVLGQNTTRRVVEWLDSAAIADAYMRESTLRFDDCRTRLYRLDWRAHTTFDYHRYSEAEALLREADETQSACQKSGEWHYGRLNGEYMRTRLIAYRPTAERVVQLERQLLTLERRADVEHEDNVYIEFLTARAHYAMTEDDESAVRLRAVIEKATKLKGARFPDKAWREAHSALAEAAARRGAAAEVLAAVAAQLGVQPDAGCVVAVNDDDRVTIAVRGADNQVVAEIRTPQEGQRSIDSEKLISDPMRARLRGCERIEVLATGAYFGAAGLLPRELRWAYRSSPHRQAPRSSGLSRQVIVTDVEPPAELGLPSLRSMSKPDASARLVSGAMATPDGVLAAIADAELVVINAHGVTDANVPSAASLVLSPDRNGAYWLTADRVKKTRLTAAPVVILAACHAGRVQVSKTPWSLASSFLSAGAQAVIAPTIEIPDDVANEVFGSIVKRMRSGSSPEQAVAEERAARGDVPWLASVVVFQ